VSATVTLTDSDVPPCGVAAVRGGRASEPWARLTFGTGQVVSAETNREGTIETNFDSYIGTAQTGWNAGLGTIG
jgi:hypothetical protein